MRVGAVVPAAGRGTRFGSAENKIWAALAGRAVLDWTLSALQCHPQIDHIVLVGAPDELERLRAAARPFAKVRGVVAGGETRQESVGNGLAALPEECEVALVHDAARPAVSERLISRIIEKTAQCGAAIPGLPITDSVKRVREGAIAEGVAREELRTAQTPQGARLADLRAAYAKLGARVAEMTDEAGVLVAAGYPVAMVPGEENNIKVTRPEDLERVARILTPSAVRTGFGYDVHAFAEGRPLWLGGVPIPHPRGLAGHSDADVLLHAVCDALLGAAAMGDIGVLFPDTDAAHKDRASMEFIREVRDRLASARWRIVNIDIALLAEEPRIGPYRERMIATLAEGLDIAPGQINLKATTSEKMGFVGRREGIACWAVATLQGDAPSP